MRQATRSVVIAGLCAACGDIGFDPGHTITNGSPSGSTTIAGTVFANVSGEQFAGRLSSSATIRNERLSFTAYDGYNRQIALSLRIAGPGTYETGGPYTPAATLLEGFGPDLRRWTSVQAPGAGTITVSFVSAESATGIFSFYVLPDSATIAAGITTPRSLTTGTFTVSLSR
jgi:hypothetical protein